MISGLPFTGNGLFKFAISDMAATTNYWAHDGTVTNEPAGHVTNTVFNGVFSDVLGAAPMTAVPPAIFHNGNDLYLRVWFSTNAAAAFSEMLPAQKIVADLLNTSVTLVGTELRVVDNGGTNAVNLNSFIDDADLIATNELNTGLALAGTTLRLTDAGGTLTADLSGLSDNSYGIVNTLTPAAPTALLNVVGTGHVTIT